ncbi:hypothetical protein [Kangiella sp. HZ709]|uniref:hypothetical protein n=1 Tax=Kangiella sp. HZ709 TaxID=2666328 RepID=UPI0012B00AED|nr:hypothetical protein [Kangiella sp. HZ709]MRX27910.1 hypothetical protein [Kangiella sp. HZ709]
MKTLIGISLVQFVLLVFVSIKVIQLSNDSSQSVISPQEAKAIQEYSGTKNNHLNFSESKTLSEVNIRTIIREELGLFVASTQNIQQDDIEQNNSQESFMAEISDGIEQNIKNQIDFSISDGNVSEKELALLESELAKLNKKDRQKILNHLSEVMSRAGATISN